MRGMERVIEHIASARRHLSRLIEQKRIEDPERVKEVLEDLANTQIDLEEAHAEASNSEANDSTSEAHTDEVRYSKV